MNLRDLPSMTALKVMEAVARHGSCSAAAVELCLTQGAVSKQLKTLEASLGRALFTRTPRGLFLTADGERYRDAVVPLLTGLLQATDALRPPVSPAQRITLRVTATFTERWLLPRLPDFHYHHPAIGLELATDRADATAQADAELRYGDGAWNGPSDYLLGRQIVLVAAPMLLARGRSLSRPSDVLRFPLLQSFLGTLTWERFLGHHGIPVPSDLKISRFDYHSLLIKAALSGLGLALVPRCLVETDLSHRSLLNPLGLGFTANAGYWLTGYDASLPAIEPFRAWLLKTAQSAEPS